MEIQTFKCIYNILFLKNITPNVFFYNILNTQYLILK